MKTEFVSILAAPRNEGKKGRILPGSFVKILAVLSCWSIGVSSAVDITVNTPADQLDSPAGAEVSLREAVRDASAGDRVIFDATVFADPAPVITLTSEIIVNQQLEVNAEGLAGKIIVSGGGSSRLFSVSNTGNLSLNGLVLVDGGGAGAVQNGDGGAIYNDGNLSITECTLRGNTAGSGGAIFNVGSLTRTLEVTNSTLSGNIANSGSGGGIYNDGALTVTQSTLAGNMASAAGGAIYNLKTLTLSQSTLSENVAPLGGGVGVFDGSRTSVINSIVAGNLTAPGGTDTDIGFNGSPPPAFNFTLTEPNLIGSNHSVSGFFPEGPLVGTPAAPLLAELTPLDNHGGVTETMALIPGSPAIDAGNASALLFDQRGVDFDRTLFSGVDLGAYELGAGEFSTSGFTLRAFVDTAKTVDPADPVDPTGSKVSFEISDDPTFAFVPSTSTIAGSGSEGLVDGPRESAQFGFVSGVAQDQDGNLFIADTGNHRIRMMTPGGVVSTIAGNGEGINSFGLVNGLGTVAKFAFPAGVAVGPDQNVYVSDTINHCIRKITRPEIPGQPWVVTTLAGSGAEGFRDGSGLNAQFDHPHGLILDPAGNVYVADADNHVVRLVTPEGNVSTYAGSGIPGGVDPMLDDCETVDASPQLICGSTTGLHAGMRVSGANITEGTTVIGIIDDTKVLLSDPATGAGSSLSLSFSGGSKLTVQFNEPFGLAFNDVGDLLYVVNRGNHVVSEIAVGPEGLVRTLAGRLQGFGDGVGAAAQFDGPAALAIDAQNNLFISDEFNHAIRKVNTFTGAVTTVAGSTTQATGFVDGDPTESLFNCPAGLIYGREGSLIVADTQNHALRRVLVDPVLVQADLGPDIGGVTEISAEFAVASYGFAADTTYYFRWVSLVPPVTPDSTQRSGQGFHLFDAPILETSEASLVTATSARFNALVDPRNSTTHLVYEFADNPEMTGAQELAVTVDAGSGAGTSVGISVPQPATPGETVYFRAVASNGRGTVSGEILSFTFPIATVASEDASNITTTTAQLNGVVNAEGSPLEVQFEYSTEADLGAPWQVSTRAGNGNTGYADTASPLDSEFNQPQEVAVSGGDVFIADRLNHVIRKVAADGVVSTLAGTNQGFAEGIGLNAQFDRPSGIATDDAGNLYVADEFNHRIRKVNISTGEVTTLAGSSTAGLADGLGAAAEFHFPSGVALDAAGNIYVSDTANHCIRKITPAGDVSTLAGSGAQGFGDGEGAVAKFSSPRGLAVNADGDVFVADTGNHRIRRVTALGEVSTLSGSGTEGFQNGAGGTAQFSMPTGVAVIGRDVFVADFGNHLVRRISEDGETITAAGDGELGLFDSPSGTLYPATAARFNAPFGIAADDAGSLWLTEQGNNDLRRIYRIPKPIVEITTPFTGASEESANVLIGNLLAGTDYYFRAVGENAISEIPGGVLSFTTLRNQEIELYDGSSEDFPQLLSDQTEGVNFGTTALGVPVLREFTIANVGEVPLGVAGLRLPPGFSSSAGSASVAPGETLTIQVSLDASVGGDYNGDFTVDSDDFIFPAFNFPIRGLVLDPPSVVTSEVTYNPLPVMNGMVNPEGSTTTVGFEYSTTPGLDGLEVTTLAGIDQPNGIAVDASGNLFIADTANHQIRKVTPSGEVSVFAGNGTAGFLDGAPGVAMFDNPAGIVINGGGTLFVADAGNHRIRAISPEGQVSTYAGFGEASFTDGVGTAARFNSPGAIAIDGADVLYVCDLGNHRLRKIASDKTVSTLAGSGVGGDLDSPVGVAVGDDGTVYVTEDSSHHILQISSAGVVTTLAGDDATSGYEDGASLVARFASPRGLAVGESEDLYIADLGNNRVRRINLNDGSVSTFAGSGSGIAMDDSGDEAGIPAPASLALNKNGDLFVGQLNNSTVRQISSATVLIELSGTLDGTESVDVSHELSGLNLERTYYYRVFASSAGGTSFGEVQDFGAAPASGFFAWQLAQFGGDASDPLIAGPEVDASGDGVSNLLKYAFFLDPSVSSQSGLPIVSNDGGEVTLTFTKVIAASDLVYAVESSSDLLTWTPSGATEQILSEGPDTQIVAASIPIVPGSTKFLRVRVTLQ